MSTAVERYDGGIGDSIVVFGSLAQQISQTEFVPDAFRNKPETVLACMLFGKECGLGPMASLNLTQSIKGKVGLKPEGMRAVVQAHGHRIWTEEYTADRVTLCGQRAGEDHVERVSWSMEDAKRADLLSNASWKKYPRAMLLARATSELCRLQFSDVTGGLAYGGDELEEIASSSPARAVQVRSHPLATDRVVDTPPLPADPETGEVRKPRARKPPVPADRVEPRDPATLPASAEQKESIADLIAAIKECGSEWTAKAKSVWREHAAEKGPERLFAGEAEKLEPALGELYREAVAAMQPTLDGSDAA